MFHIDNIKFLIINKGKSKLLSLFLVWGLSFLKRVSDI